MLLYDKLDIWEVKPDGSGATRLTNGAAGELRHRVVRLDPDAEWIDRTERVVVLAVRTAIEEVRLCEHRAGSGAQQSRRWCCSTSASIALAKAKRADRFVYASPGFRRLT